MEKKYYYWLDPIRAVAAILVLLVHARGTFFNIYTDLEPSSQNCFTAILYFICNQGKLAVICFYILSGFLVGGNTIKKYRNNRISALSFFLDRLFRIGFPLFSAILFISLTNLFIDRHLDIITSLGNLVGLNGVLVNHLSGVFWTLPYEIWFYAIILAFLMLALNQKPLLGATIGIISLTIFTYSDPMWFFIIMTGIIAFYLSTKKIKNITLVCVWGVFALSFAVSQLSRGSHVEALTLLSGLNLRDMSFLVLSGSLAVIISQIVNNPPHSQITKVIHRIGNFFAKFSFSLFLIHFQVLDIYAYFFEKQNTVNGYTLLLFFALLIFCVLVSYLFYFLVERNTKKVQSYILNKFGI